jgi:hypothetical protein
MRELTDTEIADIAGGETEGGCFIPLGPPPYFPEFPLWY